MSETGPTVPGMTEPPRRYDVTITVDQDGGHRPNPAEFAVAAQQAGIGQSGQHRQRAHGRADRQHRHSAGRRSARGRSRRPSHRVRCAKAYGRVADPLTVRVVRASIVTVRLPQPSRSACQLAKASSRQVQVMARGILRATPFTCCRAGGQRGHAGLRSERRRDRLAPAGRAGAGL